MGRAIVTLLWLVNPQVRTVAVKPPGVLLFDIGT